MSSNTTEPCPHELTPATCGSCRHLDGTGDTIQRRYVFTARHPGHCRSCDWPIEPGERIVRTGPVYVHAGSCA